MIFNPPSVNALQKTLDAQLLAGATASMTLNNVTSIVNGPGVVVVDRVDSNGDSTASKREYISFTAVSGSTVTGLTRNVDGGGSDQDHAVGAIVEFVNDVVQAKEVKDIIETEHSTAGVHSGLTSAIITNTGTGNGLFINQDGNGVALNIDNDGTNNGIVVTTAALAAGASGVAISLAGANATNNGLHGGVFVLNNHASNTLPLIRLVNLNGAAGATNARMIHISDQETDNTATVIDIDKDGNGIALNIDSEATTNSAIFVEQAVANDTASMRIGHGGTVRFEIIRNDDVTTAAVVMRLGTSFIWVDATGDLRISTTYPTSDTGGTIVGTQS